MLCSLSPHISTHWGYPLISPLKRVGWSGLSWFSLASCGPGVEKGQLYVWLRQHPSLEVHLVFYSTVQRVDLPGGCPMEAVGVQKLY